MDESLVNPKFPHVDIYRKLNYTEKIINFIFIKTIV